MNSNQKVKDLEVLLKQLGYVDEEGKLTESGADALVRFVPTPKELEEGLTIGDTDDYHISLECDKSFDDEGKVECFGVSISGYLGEGNGSLVLAEKESIVAIRDYLNKFLEYFFE